MAANATSAEACIASWGASEVNPTSASIKRASSHLNVTHAYPYLISAKLSSSGAPDAPESVGSWGFDEDSDSSQSSQFWDSSLCETPQRTKGMPNEDQAADPGCCTFEIDLSDLIEDALSWLPASGCSEYPAPPKPPSCPLAWPQTPHSASSSSGIEHNATFTFCRAACAGCRNATSLGGKAFLPESWSERTVDQECALATPEMAIATRRRRTLSWPARTIDSEHNFSVAPDCDFIAYSAPYRLNDDSGRISGMPFTQMGNQGQDEGPNDTRGREDRARLSLSSLRRSLSLNGAISSRRRGVRTSFILSPAGTASPSSSAASTGPGSARGDESSSSSPTLRTSTGTVEPTCDDSQRPVTSGSLQDPSQSDTRFPVSAFQLCPLPSSSENSPACEGPALHGSSDAPGTLDKYLPLELVNENDPVSHHQPRFISPHAGAHRDLPSVPASPGAESMDFDFAEGDYDPDHFERREREFHHLEGGLRSLQRAGVSPRAEQVRDGSPYGLQSASLVDRVHDETAGSSSWPVRLDSRTSVTPGKQTSPRPPSHIPDGYRFELHPGPEITTPFASCTSLVVLDNTVVDTSPTLPPCATLSPAPQVSTLPLDFAPYRSGVESPLDTPVSPSSSTPSSGAATPLGQQLLTPLEGLIARYHDSDSDDGCLPSANDMFPTPGRGTQPLRIRQSPGRAVQHAQSSSISPKVSLDQVSLPSLPSSRSHSSLSHSDGQEQLDDGHSSKQSSATHRDVHDAQASSRNGSGNVEQPPTSCQQPLDYHSRRPSVLAPSKTTLASAPPSAPLPSLPPSRPPLSARSLDHSRHSSSAGSLQEKDEAFATSRSVSRFSQSTQASVSSDGSGPVTPPSSRNVSTHIPWTTEKRTTVSTVLEEETLDDYALGRSEQDYESGFFRSPHNGQHRLSPSPEFPRADYKAHAHRLSVVSSAPSSASSRQAFSHPFAYRRESIYTTIDDLDMLAAPRPQALPSSNALPALYDSFKANSDASSAQQVALLSAEEDVDEVICPVCCESLKVRLPGEKPHVVPECGHGLHEECFTTVYGAVPPEGSRKNIGVCGVCRLPMRVSSGSVEKVSQKKNKLAALMGGGEGGRSQISNEDAESGNKDDPVEHLQSPTGSGNARPAEPLKVVVPNIHIKSEQPSVKRSSQTKQAITCMVTIEVPPAADTSFYPARPRQSDGRLTPPHSANSQTGSAGFSQELPSPFTNVVADLRRRVVDFRSQGLDVLGQLKLFDILPVRKGSDMGDFHLYLFQGALVCITEERKQNGAFRNLFAGSGSKNGGTNGSNGRSVLKVKGLIHHLHVREVQDTSTSTEYSVELTVDTNNKVDKFQICFKDHSSHEMWKGTLRRLVDEANVPWSARPMSSSTTQSDQRSVSRLSPPISGMFDPPESTMSCAGLCPGDLAFQVPIARHHTPIDLVIVISTPSPSQGSSAALPLKLRLMRSSLQFVLACMGPRDRISIVSSESGPKGTMRKTPLLNATRHDSRLKLETFIDGLGLGRIENDEFDVPGFYEDEQDVVAAINVGLDVVLGRKSKNPITGLLLISDTNDQPARAHLNLVNARLDAAKVQVHAFGYGKAHDPTPLWGVSNHTHGTYTFVKEWYHLRDALAGVLGGLMSIALTNMKLRLTCQDPSFRVAKVSGVSSAIISSNGKEVDVDIPVLCHNDRREILVEFDLIDPNAPPSVQSPTGTTQSRTSATGSPVSDEDRAANNSLSHISGPSPSMSPGMTPEMSPGQQSFTKAGSSVRRPSIHGGYDILSLNENFDDAHDELPVVEVDCSFHDPLVTRSATRLTNPVLLTLPVLPQHAPAPVTMGEPSIIRRRMELLTSDMMTRAMMAASRKNFSQAKLALRGTKRIVEKMADDMRRVISQSAVDGGGRSRREIAFIQAVEGLAATMQDIDSVLDGLEEVNMPTFEIDCKNYAAQQTVVLRTQRSWTVRTPTEMLYATASVRALIQASAEYASRS